MIVTIMTPCFPFLFCYWFSYMRRRLLRATDWRTSRASRHSPGVTVGISTGKFFLSTRKKAHMPTTVAHLFNVVLFQSLGRAVYGVMLHVLGHVSVLDNGLPLRHDQRIMQKANISGFFPPPVSVKTKAERCRRQDECCEERVLRLGIDKRIETACSTHKKRVNTHEQQGERKRRVKSFTVGFEKSTRS